MQPKPLRKPRILVTIALIASLSGSNYLVRSSPAKSIDYSFSFDDNGITITNITYRDDQVANGTVWMLVPKGSGKWSLSVSEGTLDRSTLADVGMVFYDNLSLFYTGPVTILINWTMEYGALLLEPQGLFVSPAVLASSDVPGYATLSLPDDVERINYATPRYTEISHHVLQFDLRQVMQNPEAVGRIYIYFSVSGQQQVEAFTEGNYTINTASRYRNLADRVLSVYTEAAPILQRLFNTTLGHTYVEFFVPHSAEEMPIGGFVPILPDRFSVGNISLNLFYFRTQEGYIESIALHELVHQYVAKSGISPYLLWLHEGLANYVGIQLTYYLGLPGARDLEDSLVFEAARIPQSEYHIIDGWTPSRTNPSYSVFQHYAIAFEIVREIGSAFQGEGEPFPGYDYYDALFRSIEEKGELPNSTWQVLSAMEFAAPNGSKVASMFRSWDFDIPDVFQIYSQILSLKETLRNPSPLISPFVPSMMAKLDEAERLLRSNEILMAQELVMEVEAFINRMWMLMAVLIVMGVTAAFSVVYARKVKRSVEVDVEVGP